MHQFSRRGLLGGVLSLGVAMTTFGREMHGAEAGQLLGSPLGGVVGDGISPFPEGSLDEALCFAVCLGCIGPQGR